MNISKAARQALIPIEKAIKSEPIEHLYQLDRNGKILKHDRGTADSVNPWFLPDETFIFTHNHPYMGYKRIRLSGGDITCAVRHGQCEFRAVSTDGFCRLVEVPQLSARKKLSCFKIIDKFELKIKKAISNEEIQSLYKKMENKLKKVGGLKFRTVLLPEAEVPKKMTRFERKEFLKKHPEFEEFYKKIRESSPCWGRTSQAKSLQALKRPELMKEV